jgi:hypothetical protein
MFSTCASAVRDATDSPPGDGLIVSPWAVSSGPRIPLAVPLTCSQRNDVTQLMPMIAAIPPVHGWRGRPRQGPGMRSTPTALLRVEREAWAAAS